jgi:hypothetical protein
MSISIAATLSLYGFVARADGSFYYGIGSLVWGHTASVKFLGGNRYEVSTHVWFYNCDGDCVLDRSETQTLFAGSVVGFLAERGCLGR